MDQPWVYLILLGLVIVVYAKIIPKSASSNQTSIKEMEETFEHFAAEMDEQNQAVIQLFSETKRDYESHIGRLSSRIEWLEKQGAALTQELAKLQAAHSQMEQAMAKTVSVPAAQQPPVKPEMERSSAAEPPPTPSEPEAPVLMKIKERYAELFRLYQQGKSTDYIARKLNMNKGEINLIIQLSKQEESLSV